jgi:hypothetical protein
VECLTTELVTCEPFLSNVVFVALLLRFFVAVGRWMEVFAGLPFYVILRGSNTMVALSRRAL